MNNSTTPVVRPHVEIVNGQPLTHSSKIAEHFGKIHRDVVRAIQNLECSDEFRLRNFAQSSFQMPMPNGGVRTYPAYTLTRDGFSFLAMGFTGKEAAKWKEAYITAFNQMEASLQAQSPPANPLGSLMFMEGADLKNRRFLVTFDDSGLSYRVKPVPDEACVTSQAQLLEDLTKGNGVWVSTERLYAFVEAATAKLKVRALMGEGSARLAREGAEEGSGRPFAQSLPRVAG